MLDDEGRLELVFTPRIDRADDTNVANMIVSEQHQVFGTLAGAIVLDDDSILSVSGLRGSAEHVHNRY